MCVARRRLGRRRPVGHFTRARAAVEGHVAEHWRGGVGVGLLQHQCNGVGGGRLVGNEPTLAARRGRPRRKAHGRPAVALRQLARVGAEPVDGKNEGLRAVVVLWHVHERRALGAPRGAVDDLHLEIAVWRTGDESRSHRHRRAKDARLEEGHRVGRAVDGRARVKERHWLVHARVKRAAAVIDAQLEPAINPLLVVPIVEREHVDGGKEEEGERDDGKHQVRETQWPRNTAAAHHGDPHKQYGTDAGQYQHGRPPREERQVEQQVGVKGLDVRKRGEDGPNNQSRRHGDDRAGKVGHERGRRWQARPAAARHHRNIRGGTAHATRVLFVTQYTGLQARNI